MKVVYFCLPALILFGACSSPSASSSSQRPTTRQLQSDSYATLYLGANNTVITKRTPAAKEQKGGYWNGDGVSGSPSIVIDLGDQEARFYRGGKLVGMSPISTGREGYRTPTGSFRITQKNQNHFSNLYGDYVDSAGNVVVRGVAVRRDRRPPGTSFQGAPMPYFMRIHGGVGMHAGYLPGVPDSHGCIRMPREMAKTFYANASHGTPVRVIH